MGRRYPCTAAVMWGAGGRRPRGCEGSLGRPGGGGGCARATEAPPPPPAQLQNQSELRAPTAEKAAFFLDAALAARSSSRAGCGEDARHGSHMLFTLHVYQYRMEKGGKGASRCPRGRVPRGLGSGVRPAPSRSPLPCGFSVWRPQPPAPHRPGQL